MNHNAAFDVREVSVALDSHDFTANRIFSFDLGPVLSRSGSILARNSERLRLALEGRIAEVAPRALTIFIGSLFYLMISPDDENEADALVVRVNIEVLKLLFGTDHLAPGQVTKLFRSARFDEADGIKDMGWTGAVTGAMSIVKSTPAPQGNGPETAAEPLHPPVDLRFVPVHDLRRSIVSTFFCSPVARLGTNDAVFGYRAFRYLGPAELPDIDAAILEYAAAFSHRMTIGGIMATVGASVNFETLAWAKGRQRYQQALREAGTIDNPYLMLKIDEVPFGVPDSRLAEMVASVRPHIKRVFVHLENGDNRFALGGNIGATGFVASLPPRASRAIVAETATSLMRMCDAQGALACVDHVDSAMALELVQAVGIRFAVGSVFGPQTLRGEEPGEVVRALLHEGPKPADANPSDASAPRP